MTVNGHTGHASGPVTVVGHRIGPFSSLTVRGHGIEVGGLDGFTGIAWRLWRPPGIAATLGRGWSVPLRWWAAPFPRPTPSLQDLARLFLSLSGSHAQWDVVVGSVLSAAGASGAGVLPGPVAPVVSAAPYACSSASVPTPGVESPAGAASATSLNGLSGAAGAHLAGRGPSQVRSVARVGLLPLLAFPAWLVRLPPLHLRLRMRAKRLVRCLLPPLGVLAWMVVALWMTAWLLVVTVLLDLALRGWVRDCGLHKLLGCLTWSIVVALPPLLRVRRKMTTLVLSTLVDLGRDDSFRSVLRFIREFHSLEEPASVAPNQCKTSLVLVYGLQSESSPDLHLPLPLTAVSPGKH